MIIDTIANAGRYFDIPDIGQALRFLAQTDCKTISEKVVIDGDRIFANPVSLVSKPEEECVFEAHRKYIDIHYIISGVEGISVREVEALTVKEPYSTEKDIGFHTGEPSGTWYLNPGEFMICWPNEAHRVAMMKGLPGEIKKIVVKVIAP